MFRTSDFDFTYALATSMAAKFHFLFDMTTRGTLKLRNCDVGGGGGGVGAVSAPISS